jgi:outer membrane protein OmpA-like peptidoglycan-associated protein
MKIKLIGLISWLLIFNQYTNAQSNFVEVDFNKLSLQFEDASAELKPEYYAYIYKLADTLQQNPRLHVLIRGHVCCVNKNQLAEKRAKVVGQYLLRYGVNKTQITTVGMRNSMPVVFPEKTKADELKNMRVDFVLSLRKEE